MARRSFLDRLAGTIRLTESLSLVEDSQAVVRALSVVQWVGILQALGSVVVLLVFDESAVAWAVAVATALFLVSWAWLAVTGDMFGSVVIALLGAPVPIYVHVRLGGYAYSGGSLFFGITVASAAALLLGRRAAMLVVAGFSGAAVVLGFLESSLRASRVPPDPTLTSLLFVVVLVTNLTVVPPVLVYLLGKVRSERERAEGLLLNMLPADVASELKRTGSTTPRRYDSISVMFADIVGFTPIASEMRPVDVVENLNVVFTRFDELAEKYRVEKIRTIGDSYMAAAGVPVARPDHAHALAAMALEMLDYARQSPFSFRIGINSGPVVAGIIGSRKFQYDVWGDTVNTAARMESHGVTGRIQITGATNELLRGEFRTTPRGPIEVKGKGTLDTWFLEGATESAPKE